MIKNTCYHILQKNNYLRTIINRVISDEEKKEYISPKCDKKIKDCFRN